MLLLAEQHHLDYVTYNEMKPGPRRAGIAIAFDDNAVDQWLGIRELLQAHGARVTFFVSRYTLITDDERAGLDVLAADGHDLEPHSVHHLHAHEYIADHGLDAFMTDEVVPSIQVLEQAGYPATTFAYPFGEHSDALDDALLQYVDRVRTTPGECPR